jgi:NAD(P)-dependent dehydrogenase (short-subunit alcohol dehydrogenase family)
LVLNAGIMALPDLERTSAGFEKQIGVNHFGHFYLTHLLLPSLLRGSPREGRVVVLSSSAHAMGGLDPGDLNYSAGREGAPGPRRWYSAWGAYGQSKAANLLFAKALADRLGAGGYPHLTAVSVHPGVIRTNLWRASWVNRILGFLAKDKTIPQGAATTVWACVCPRVMTEGLRGAYLSDCSPISPSTAICRDEDGTIRDQLWLVSQQELQKALKKEELPTLNFVI